MTSCPKVALLLFFLDSKNFSGSWCRTRQTSVFRDYSTRLPHLDAVPMASMAWRRPPPQASQKPIRRSEFVFNLFRTNCTQAHCLRLAGNSPILYCFPTLVIVVSLLRNGPDFITEATSISRFPWDLFLSFPDPESASGGPRPALKSWACPWWAATSVETYSKAHTPTVFVSLLSNFRPLQATLQSPLWFYHMSHI